MPTAKKLPSGSWRVRVYNRTDDGQIKYESFTAPTKREAERKAAMWAVERSARSKPRAGLTLGEAMDGYIDACRAAQMSPTTIRGLLTTRRNGWPTLVHRRVADITLPMIQAAVTQRAQNVSPKTIRNGLDLLRPVLTQHRKDIDLGALKLPRAERTEIQIPTAEQVRALIDDARVRNHDMLPPILLAAMLGLRRSEICALRWGDIAPDGAGGWQIHIHAALVREADRNAHVRKAPKTRAGDRWVQLPASVYALLEADGKPADEPITRLTPNAITERYQRMRDRLGLPGSFHALRHFHASVMVALGVPEAYIVADMGHSSPDMVRRVYGHIMGDKRQAVNALMVQHADALLGNNDTKHDTRRRKNKQYI